MAIGLDARGWRSVPLDGAALMFHRDSGTNVRIEDAATAALRQAAPRAVQLGITNRCNLACGFCSRDPDAASTWTADEVVAWLGELAAAGVLEVAFGGGEPWMFPGFDALVRRLHDETPLAVSFTTNGLWITRDRVRAIAGAYGQLRVSLYDDDDWRARLAVLASERARFGVNDLITPAKLAGVEARIVELVELGCPDVLLLCYKGRDAALHLAPDEAAGLARRVAVMARALGGRVALKLDVCWGERMEAVPRFAQDGGAPGGDCGAGRDFVVVTSDRRVMPCSFHDLAVPVASAADVMRVWRERRLALAAPTTWPGCARAPGYGLARVSRARTEVSR